MSTHYTISDPVQFAVVAAMTTEREYFFKAKNAGVDNMLTCAAALSVWQHFTPEGIWDTVSFAAHNRELLVEILQRRDEIMMHDSLFDSWLGKLKEGYHKRIFHKAIREAHELPLMEGLALVERARDTIYGRSGEPDIEHEVDRGLSEIDDLCAGRQPANLISWGIPLLDREFKQVAKHEMVVIGARPGVGKSALLAQVALSLRAQGKPVSIFSLEMRTSEIMQRMASIKSGVGKWQLGPLHPERNLKYRTAFADIAKDRGIHWHTVTQTLDNIIATATFDHKAHGVQAVFLDYLQLVEVPKSQKRLEALGEITRSLKLFASRNSVPVFTASQLNRGNDKDAREPRLSDLRESGSIEQDADRVLLLHRDDAAGVDKIIQAKQRAGGLGAIDVVFDKAATRYNFDNVPAKVAAFPQQKQRKQDWSDYDDGY